MSYRVELFLLLFLEFQILVALGCALGCEKHRLWVSQAWIQVQLSHSTCMTLDRLLKLPESHFLCKMPRAFYRAEERTV